MVQKHSIAWDDIAAILAVAAAGSLREAANTMGVAHTTLARRVAGAEQSLGAVAFVRSARGYTLTDAGKTIIRHAERIAEEVDAIGRAVGGGDRTPRGDVRVTMPPAVLSHCVAAALGSFREHFPAIRLDIDTGYGFRDLDRQEADIAVRFQNAPLDDLVGIRVGTSREAAYVASHLPGERVDDAGLIAWTTATSFVERARRFGLGKRPIVAICSDIDGQAKLAASGAGIAVLPCLLGDSEPGLTRLPPRKTAAAQAIWVLTHPDLRNSARVRAVSGFLVDALRRSLHRFEGRPESPDRAP